MCSPVRQEPTSGSRRLNRRSRPISLKNSVAASRASFEVKPRRMFTSRGRPNPTLVASSKRSGSRSFFGRLGRRRCFHASPSFSTKSTPCGHSTRFRRRSGWAGKRRLARRPQAEVPPCAHFGHPIDLGGFAEVDVRWRSVVQRPHSDQLGPSDQAMRGEAAIM